MKQLKIQTSWLKVTEALSDVEMGRLFRGMLKYASSGEEPKLTGSERIMWAQAKDEVDRQRSISEKRSVAGTTGCNKRWQTIANDSKPSQTIANDSKEKAPPVPPEPPLTPVKENLKKTLSKERAKERELSPALADAVQAFKEHRAKLRKPMTELAVELMLKKLERMAPGDERRQLAMLMQSVENGWTGVWELQEPKKERNTLKNYQEQGVSHASLSEIEMDVNEL